MGWNYATVRARVRNYSLQLWYADWAAGDAHPMYAADFFVWSRGSCQLVRWTHPEGFALARAVLRGDSGAYAALLDWMQEYQSEATRVNLDPLPADYPLARVLAEAAADYLSTNDRTGGS